MYFVKYKLTNQCKTVIIYSKSITFINKFEYLSGNINS